MGNLSSGSVILKKALMSGEVVDCAFLAGPLPLSPSSGREMRLTCVVSMPKFALALLAPLVIEPLGNEFLRRSVHSHIKKDTGRLPNARPLSNKTLLRGALILILI